MATQLKFMGITAHAFRQHRKACLTYMAQHKDTYTTWAHLITPDLNASAGAGVVWERLAFAILSAREPFAATCRAWEALRKFSRHEIMAMDKRELKTLLREAGITLYTSKVRYLRGLGNLLANNPADWPLKWSGETWHEYRMRLTQVPGLGLTKASFAACLLYPTTADVACLDTWMLKVFEGPKQPKLTYYLQTERRVRRWGRMVGVPTFVAQWMIWDHARGSSESHGILAGLPGAHKDGSD